MKLLNRLVILLIFFVSWGCSNESALPNTPEEVLKQYQAYIDKNQFEEARMLSTNRERARLINIEEVIAGDLNESTVLTSVFLKIDCRIENDLAECFCLLKDEYEEYEAVFRLIKVKGRWLVDAPTEEIIIESDVIEEVLEDIEF